MQSDGTIGSILAGFALGVASSAAVAIPFYRQQQKDAKESEDRLVLLMEQQLRVAVDARSTVRELTIQNEELKRSFADLRSHLPRAAQTRAPEDVLGMAEHYATAARSLAGESSTRLLRTESLPDRLTIDWLRQLHGDLFPSGYELGGRLRTIQVWVGPASSTQNDAVFVPPPPAEVPQRLANLLDRWNRSLASVEQASREAQSFELARFHHQLVVVHPFLDGNGVLARTVTGLQMKRLTGSTPEIVRTNAEYYVALQAADAGQYEMLSRLLQAQLPHS